MCYLYFWYTVMAYKIDTLNNMTNSSDKRWAQKQRKEIDRSFGSCIGHTNKHGGVKPDNGFVKQSVVTVRYIAGCVFLLCTVININVYFICTDLKPANIVLYNIEIHS